MATSCNNSSSSQPCKVCSTCETNTPEQYCNDCQMSFCGTCVKVHNKLKGSMDHIVKEVCLSDNATIQEGSQIAHKTPFDVPQQCSKHTNETVKQFCRGCVEYLCTRCLLEHADHCLEVVNRDNMLELNKRVYTKTVDILTTAIQELEHHSEHIDTFSGTLNKSIQQLQGQKENIRTTMEDLNKTFSNLNSVRDSDDIELLWNAVSESSVTTEGLNRVKTQLIRTCHITKQGKIIKEGAESVEVKSAETQCVMFQSQSNHIQQKEMETQCLMLDDGWGMYDALQLCDIYRVPRSGRAKGYKICQENDSNVLTIHGVFKSDVRYFDLLTGIFTHVECDRTIWEMVMLESRGFLVVHGSQDKVCLLDSNFKCIDTLYTKEGFDAVGVGKIGRTRYLLYVVKSKYPYGGLWTEVLVSKSGMKIARENRLVKYYDDEPIFMSMLKEQNNAIACSSNFLYKFNYDINQFDRANIKKFTHGGISCMTTDTYDNVFVGDDAGYIHLFSKNGNHKLILTITDKPCNICVKGDRLIITTTTNQIFVYTITKPSA